MMVLHGLIYYMEPARYGIWDMLLVVWYMGKTPYVVWYVLTVWHGKNTVYGEVRVRFIRDTWKTTDELYSVSPYRAQRYFFCSLCKG